MAFIGLKAPVFAPITGYNPNGFPTYGQGSRVGMAMQANISITLADSKLYADDVVAEIDNSFVSGTISIGVDDISPETSKMWFSTQTRMVNGEEVYLDAGNTVSPEGLFGFYRVRRKRGVRSIRAFVYLRTQFGIPSEDARTKGENIEWQTPTAAGEIMALEDADNTWRIWKQFDVESDAIAWLDEWANIGEPADLTALNAKITEAAGLDPEDYTSASWVGVANALSDARFVVQYTSPSQSRVDAAVSLLDTAIQSLVTR